MVTSRTDFFRDEPTTSIIAYQGSRLRELWNNARRQWEINDKYYNLEYDVWIGAERLKRPQWLRLGRARSIVDHAVDHHMSDMPKYHRYPAFGDADAQKKADKVERFLQASAEAQALLEPTLTFKAIAKHFMLYGYAPLETCLDPRVRVKMREARMRQDAREALAKGETPAESYGAGTLDDMERMDRHILRTALPFRMKAIHPSNIFLDPWEKQPQVALKHIQATGYEIAGMLANRRGMRKKVANDFVLDTNPFAKYWLDEWWTEYWHAVMLNGSASGGNTTGIQGFSNTGAKMLFVEENTWGFVPYSHAYSGFGQEPTNRDNRDPKYMAVGLLEAVMNDIRAQSQAVSARHQLLQEAAEARVILRGIDAEDVRNQLDEGPYIETDQQGAVERMPPPRIGREYFQHDQEIQQDIEDSTYSRQLGGVRQPGVNTVGQTLIFQGAAGRKFVGTAHQMEHLASVNGEHQLQLVDMMDLKLMVKGNTIERSDLDSDYYVTATFEIKDPMFQLQKQELGLRELQAGVLSSMTYWEEYADRKDTSRERTRILMDALRANPMIQQEQVLDVAREVGLGDLVERAMERQRQEEQAGAAGGGAPQPAQGVPY